MSSGKAPQVFLSYSNTDRPIASQLARALKERGVSTWWDAEIRLGDRWEKSIEQALLDADAVVVLVTPQSVESRWVTMEWSGALANSRLVIPVVAGGLSLADLPYALSHIQGVLFDSDNPAELDRLVSAIKKTVQEVPAAAERPSEVVDVERIVEMATQQVLERIGVAPLESRSAQKTDAALVFAIMSFAQDMEPTFEAIAGAAEAVGWRAERVKDIPGDYRITDQILGMIRSSRLIVADLTHERPNVYFELGYARGIGKTVVTILKSGANTHFDVRDWTFLEYSDSRPLERDLLKRFKYEQQSTP